jgi:hypothetical protein
VNFVKPLRNAFGSSSHRPQSRQAVLTVELLETRALLSANGLITPTPDVRVLHFSGGGPAGGYSPAQIRQAYTLAGLPFGGSTPADGTGQTIAIVDAYNDPTIASDLSTFDAYFGLPRASLSVVNETGGTTLPAGTDAGWTTETALDVEWAHAIAPGAKIVLVEASSDSLSDLLTAVTTAAGYAGVSVVSMSWGGSEFRSQTRLDSNFTTPAGHSNVAFVAASGDSGSGAEWPASSPNVLAVGGTTLTLSSSGGFGTEAAWTDGGGGVSRFETAASSQQAVTGNSQRTTPDVAYDANPNTGYAVYSGGGWEEVGGTSAGAPQWAALVAVADQGRALAGQGPLSTAQLETLLYSAPSADFHDITSGSNGNAASVGYDLASGLGTPIASNLIPYLAGFGASTGGGGNGSGTAAQNSTTFVTGLYQDLLDRTPNAVELNSWVDAIMANGLTDQQVATAIWHSAEHRGIEVDNLYLTILGRTADAAGRQAWMNALLSGQVNELGLENLFFNSAEFQSKNGTPAAFITAVYTDALGRPPSAADEANWQATLAAFGANAVTTGVLTSAESFDRMITLDYSSYLGRTPSSVELDSYLSQLQAGRASIETAAEIILGSAEYASKH